MVGVSQGYMYQGGFSGVSVYCSSLFLTSLVPRPSPFFVLRFSFSIIHGSERARKTGKAWEHLSCEWRLVDARLTYWGRGPRSNNVLDFIIEHSNDSQDS